jgi:hypothetical protein
MACYITLTDAADGYFSLKKMGARRGGDSRCGPSVMKDCEPLCVLPFPALRAPPRSEYLL